MSGGEWLAIAGIAVMVVTAGLLAAAETALTRVSTARAEALVEEGRRRSGLVRRLVDERDRILNPLLLVLLACQIGTATLVAVLIDRRWGTGALVAAFVLELVILFAAAEALPKGWALANPDRSATALAPMVRVLSSVAPLRWLANRLGRVAAAHDSPTNGHGEGEVSEEELLALAEEAAASDAIDEDERVLIEHIIEFGDTIAREVMVPRPDMVVLEAGTTVAEATDVVIARGFSRLPAIVDGVDDVLGIVHSKDLMRASVNSDGAAPAADVVREARFIPETKRIAELLREMQADKFHMAIVVDEYGGTAGLVTLEDLIEEVVGEIVDEFDVEQPMIERLDAERLRVNGRAALVDLAELLDVELPEGEWSTVGGLIFNTLGHVPSVGEALDVDGHRLLVERIQGRRIARVLVTPLAQAQAGR